MVLQKGWGSRLWARTTARVEKEKSREMPRDALIKKTPLTGPQKGVPEFKKMTDPEFNVFKAERVRQIYEDNRTKFGLLAKKAKEEKEERQKRYVAKGVALKQRYEERSFQLAEKYNVRSDKKAIKKYTKALATKNPITSRDIDFHKGMLEGQLGIDRGRSHRAQFDRGRVITTSSRSRGRVIDMSPWGAGRRIWFKRV